ncbi:MAG: hypothetical protein Q8O05_04900 [Chloroflexota bacterium]|nr:hypothetical protein [Chloroflexota bacterium]
MKVRGDTYNYPGIGKLHFYSHKGEEKWFSGTLVVGDTTDLDDEDKSLMIRDGMDFRIKMDKDSQGQWQYKVYCLDFVTASLSLT